MKIVFNNEMTYSEIGIEQIDSDEIVIAINNTKSGDDFESLDYVMTKDELREFIGSLLHIQSKLKSRT